MRILFVVNWYTLQSESVLRAGVFHYEQCKALQNYSDVCLYWPFDNEVASLEKNDEFGLTVYRSPFNYDGKFSSIFKAKKYLDQVIEEFKPDIIHANCAMPCGFICVLAAKKKNIPVVLTEHSPIEDMNINNKLKKLLRGYTYYNTNINVCVSKDSGNRLSEIFPKFEYVVNYNAVISPSAIEFTADQFRVDGEFNFGIVAGFYSKDIKGYQYLIPAVKEVNEKGYKITLHICGGGEYEEYYKKLASDIGITDKCIFYGQCDRSKVYSLISNMDFCVSSSIYECSGVSVQEEMLLGKPILVTKSGGANSLTTSETAIVVDRGSTEALVNGIIDMIKKFDSFDSKIITEYAEENFEISNVTKRYMDIYQEVLNGGYSSKKRK